MQIKKIAVLLSTFNGEKYLRQFLVSLTMQNLKMFDLIVRDDGSTDSTIDILKEFSKKINITIMPGNGLNLGPANSFFELLKFCGSKYSLYFFADQDDWWFSDKIKMAVEKLSAFNKESPLLYCSAIIITDQNLNKITQTQTGIKPSKYNALVQNIAIGCTICINQASRNILLSKLPEHFSMHDWWMYLVVSFFGTIVYDPGPTIFYRVHNNNFTRRPKTVFRIFVKRIQRFRSRVKKDVFPVSSQSKDFLKCFGNQLNFKDKSMVKRLLKPKGFKTNLRNAIDSPFFMQSKIDTLLLKIIFIMGKY